MVDSCPNCSRSLREGMNFCPGCGTPLRPAGGPSRPSAREGTLRFQGPAPAPYPLPYMAPPFYPAPLTPRRAVAIAAGIMMIITACFSFISALAFLLDAWWYSDLWLPLGLMNIVAFGLGIVGAVGVFRRSWRHLDLGAAIFLVLAAILSLYDMEIYGLFVLVLSIISVVLVAVSWSQFQEPRGMGFPMFPMMPPHAGMGAPPPGLMITPPANMGAPPPAYMPNGPVDTGSWDDGVTQVDEFIGPDSA